MAVHRNVYTFNKPQVRFYNNTRFTGMPTQQYGSNSSGSIWSNPMALMMMMPMVSDFFGGIAGLIRSNRAEKAEKAAEQKTADSIDLNSLKELYGDKWKIVERDGKFTAVNKTDGTQHVDKTYAEMLEALKPAGTKEIKPTTDPNAISVEYAQARIKDAGLDGKITITDDGKIKYTKPATEQEVTLTLNEANLTVAIGEILSYKPEHSDAEGDKGNYSLEENKSLRETVKTIPFGGPWHYAQYYQDENGTQIKIGSPDFNAIVQNLKTEMGSVEGNNGLRTLPSSITIGGKTYTIMNEDKRNALGLKGQSGGANATYKVISSASTYTIYQTDASGKKTIVESGLDKATADAKLKELNGEA